MLRGYNETASVEFQLYFTLLTVLQMPWRGVVCKSQCVLVTTVSPAKRLVELYGRFWTISISGSGQVT